MKKREEGFTIIEILASIAVLAIIVVTVAALFSDSQTAWQTGTNRARNNSTGRTVIDRLTRDLQSAVADEKLSFAIEINSNTNMTYIESDELNFVSFLNDGSKGIRSATEIQYWVREMSNSTGRALGRYELIRSSTQLTNGIDNCYDTTDWYTSHSTNIGVVAENVAAFIVGSMDNDGDMIRNYISTESTNDNTLPRYVDIYLELLDSDKARQIADIPTNVYNYTDMLERSVRRYTTRVYFDNRNGYKDR